MSKPKAFVPKLIDGYDGFRGKCLIALALVICVFIGGLIHPTYLHAQASLRCVDTGNCSFSTNKNRPECSTDLDCCNQDKSEKLVFCKGAGCQKELCCPDDTTVSEVKCEGGTLVGETGDACISCSGSKSKAHVCCGIGAEQQGGTHASAMQATPTAIPSATPTCGNCNDNNDCTDDSCVNGTCTHTNNSASCDDGNGCTLYDTCSGGSCAPGDPYDCRQACQVCVNIDNSPRCDQAPTCPSPSPSVSPSVSPTVTATGSPTATATAARTPTPTTKVSPTASPKPSGSATPAKTASPTPVKTPTGTSTSTITNTSTPTNTPTVTRTKTPTKTPTRTGTSTITNTPARTTSGTPVTSASATPRVTPSVAPTATATTAPTSTSTRRPTATPTPTCPVCNDNNVCTDDSCVNGACVFTNNSASCNDGNGCTDGDVCSGGSCQSGSPYDCRSQCQQCVNDGGSPRCDSTSGGSCDDADSCTSGDTCSASGCSGSPFTPTCGDLKTECGEECDDGNSNACDGCSPSCKTESCGNGIVECAEQCDDGNTTSGDGCSSTCLDEPKGCIADWCGPVCDFPSGPNYTAKPTTPSWLVVHYDNAEITLDSIPPSPSLYICMDLYIGKFPLPNPNELLALRKVYFKLKETAMDACTGVQYCAKDGAMKDCVFDYTMKDPARPTPPDIRHDSARNEYYMHGCVEFTCKSGTPEPKGCEDDNSSTCDICNGDGTCSHPPIDECLM